MIRGVTADDFPRVRGKVMPFLEHFADRSPLGGTAADLAAVILERDAQLWVIGDFQAVALTEVTPDAVHITHCAGERREDWQQAFDDEIRAWARALGKKRVVATVRPGWARWGKSRGYREAHRQMVVEV